MRTDYREFGIVVWSTIVGMIGGFALCVIVGDAKAQTPEAKRAVVEISAGQYGGSGVLVRREGNRYWGRTAAHVVGKHRSITVDVQGRRLPATVTDRVYSGTKDIARFVLTSPKKLVVVRIAPRQPAIGERVWSAGYPGFTDKIIVRQGKRVAPSRVGFQVVSGDSGSPVFSKHGVVGILSGYMQAWKHGPPTGDSAYTECRIFGRRRGGEDGGRCGPLGCRPDKGTTDPGEIIDTPVDEPADVPEPLPPIVPPKKRQPIVLVILLLAAVVGGVVIRHFRNEGK